MAFSPELVFIGNCVVPQRQNISLNYVLQGHACDTKSLLQDINALQYGLQLIPIYTHQDTQSLCRVCKSPIRLSA